MKVTESKTMDEVKSKAKGVKSYKKSTELSMAGMPGTLSLVEMYEAPKTQAMKMEMMGQVFQSGYLKGNKGYEQNAQTGKKNLTKEKIKERKKSFGLYPELNYEKYDVQLEAIGIESIGKEQFYVVKIVNGEKEEYNYYDASNFLLSKKTSIESSPDGGTVENTVEYGDYKNVNGFLIPHSQNMSIGQMSFSGTISSFEFNSELDFSEFKKK